MKQLKPKVAALGFFYLVCCDFKLRIINNCSSVTNLPSKVRQKIALVHDITIY